MNLDRLRPALVVVLGVLAISAVAASMDGGGSETQIGSGDGPGEGAGDGIGTGGSESSAGERTTSPPGSGDVWNWIRLLVMVVWGGGALAYLGYVAIELWRNGRAGFRNVLRLTVPTLLATTLASIFVIGPQVFMWSQQAQQASRRTLDMMMRGTGSASADAATDVANQLPSVALVLFGLLVGVAVLMAVFTDLFATDADDGDSTPVESATEELEPTAAVHTGTARRLDDVEATNDVYRAWRELVTAVDGVSLRTHTPTEIASRATDDGFDRTAVRTLTELFEEVRYGHRPATRDRESRAQSALDRLSEAGDRA